MKVIISGGGTGGHIFPALAIANAIKELLPETEFLFVGAEDRMEMQKVPQAGYNIVGLPIAGIQRSLSLKNLSFPFKLVNSLIKARKVVKDFAPDVVIGVGGYASGPTLWMASSMGISTFLQEQNSYAGLTNKLLAKSVKKIFVAYEGMEAYFPAKKIMLTGNPVRKEIIGCELLRLPGLFEFKLSAERKTLLVIGGSLGARTINESIAANLDKIKEAGYQLIWQTGKSFFPKAQELCAAKPQSNGWGDIKVFEFIGNMNLAYACADVVISRAGALSITELCTAGKPSVLVPSPNVSEDHQTKNAMALVRKDAALIVADKDAKEKLVDAAIALLADNERQTQISNNISAMALPNAATTIAKEIIDFINNKK
ncbi:MAG: hypothetical protein RLZZ175_1411 [Bacteroidota bacterium]